MPVPGGSRPRATASALDYSALGALGASFLWTSSFQLQPLRVSFVGQSIHVLPVSASSNIVFSERVSGFPPLIDIPLATGWICHLPELALPVSEGASAA